MEFSLGAEDFPALPGFKGGSNEVLILHNHLIQGIEYCLFKTSTKSDGIITEHNWCRKLCTAR